VSEAANGTIGSITAQEMSQDTTQFPVARSGKLATSTAIKDVDPDWMTPNTK
jgi:hypothetical protein